MDMSGTDLLDQATFGAKVIDMPFGTGIPASKMDRMSSLSRAACFSIVSINTC